LSGTSFRHQLKYCTTPSQELACTTEMMTYHGLLFIFVISSK